MLHDVSEVWFSDFAVKDNVWLPDQVTGTLFPDYFAVASKRLAQCLRCYVAFFLCVQLIEEPLKIFVDLLLVSDHFLAEHILVVIENSGKEEIAQDEDSDGHLDNEVKRIDAVAPEEGNLDVWVVWHGEHLEHSVEWRRQTIEGCVDWVGSEHYKASLARNHKECHDDYEDWGRRN